MTANEDDVGLELSFEYSKRNKHPDEADVCAPWRFKLHRWTKWKPTNEDIKAQLTQQRRCLRCGLHQRKLI